MLDGLSLLYGLKYIFGLYGLEYIDSVYFGLGLRYWIT